MITLPTLQKQQQHPQLSKIVVSDHRHSKTGIQAIVTAKYIANCYFLTIIVHIFEQREARQSSTTLYNITTYTIAICANIASGENK